jgi:hypothetical protein
LKNGGFNRDNAQWKQGAVCGFLEGGSGGLEWHVEGKLHWASGCDLPGNDLSNESSKDSECGSKCQAHGGCTNFAWTNHNGGTCWIKGGQVSEANAVKLDGAVCGFFEGGSSPTDPHNGGQNGPSAWNVKATHWAGATDAGGESLNALKSLFLNTFKLGCQVPQGDYVVWDALALGQEDALGSLKWRQGLCGQVLQVDCGHGPVNAVVASTCNLGSNSCGVDMITKTWNKATGWQGPGIEHCTVTLSSQNPMSGGPRCYARPDSGGIDNAYYVSLGVFNTNGRIPSGASLAGVQGQFMSGSGYFSFSSGGAFNRDSSLEFKFENGQSQWFKLGDCQTSGVQIFS